MKRRSRLPVFSILLASPILTPFAAFETPLVDFAVGGGVVAQEPLEGADGDFELVAPGEFDLAPDDETDAPLATEAPNESSDADRPALPFALDADQNAKSGAEQNADAPVVLEAQTLDSDEMKRLSQDPLFQEFSAAFDEAAPLPALPNLDAFGAEQNADALLRNGDAQPAILPASPAAAPVPVDAAAKLASSTAALDEILAIAAVDLASLPLSETERAILSRLDAEIARLCPLWLDAELNRNVVGRRERVWERAEAPGVPNFANVLEATEAPNFANAPEATEVPNFANAPEATETQNFANAPEAPETQNFANVLEAPETQNFANAPETTGRPLFARPEIAVPAVAPFTGVRFETNDPRPVASASDWALAPAAPFFFEVVDPTTGAVFYTKAGDFEPFEGGAALVRGDRVFVATIEPGPGVPSGRAERIRVLKNGQIQGVDAAGKLVVDFKLGTFSLYLFDNPARLASADGVFFVPTAESGEPRPAKLPPHSQVGVESGQLLLSNGRPDEIFARIVVLCKSKKRLVEILTQPRVAPETPTR